jgi:hypothetical protein
MLRLKGQEISDLIQRAKVEGAQDRGLIEILTKWEEANQKLFDANRPLEEGDDQNDISLLEVTKEEISKARESEELATRRQTQGGTSSNQAPDKAKEAAAAKKRKAKEEEEEMRRYMNELKKKEEEV